VRASLWGVLGAALLVAVGVGGYPYLFPAVPSVDLPAEVRGEPGTFIRVAARTNGKEVQWLSVDPGLNVFPPDLLRDSKVVAVSSPKAGRYRLYAWTALKGVPGEATLATIIVGEVPPPGPNPPGPNPPPPPPPVDPFVASLKAAYDADPGPDKATKLPLLAGVYRSLGETVGVAAELKTAGDIADTQRKAVSAVLPANDLKGVRQAVADELVKTLPTDAETPATPEVKSKAAGEFRRVAAAMEAVR
jgi:hypothetical protein